MKKLKQCYKHSDYNHKILHNLYYSDPAYHLLCAFEWYCDLKEAFDGNELDFRYQRRLVK
ncbi:MAG: hypothetical protein VSS75_019010 [Candidatus Parabeggiatoa sp.]|nr:hypothetical protein [Candidatus Parabeggiatoa sp.]